jgi:hypothetical protein
MSGFNLSALAVRERSVTLFLLLAIFIAGIVAFLKLGRAEDPSLRAPANLPSYLHVTAFERIKVAG